MFRDDSCKNRKINSADGKSSSTDSSISEEPMLCIKLAPVLSFVSFFVVIIYLFLTGIIDAIVSIGLICLLLFLSKLMKFFKSKLKHGPETNVSTETSDNSSNSYREVIEENSSEKNIPKRKSPTKPSVTENRKKSTINSFKPTIRKIEETMTEKSNMKSQITITIVFENDEYDQLTKKLSLNTTIGDIKKNIANEYDIKNEIVIKYKKNVSETVPIDSKKTISEIQSKIMSKDRTGRYNYFLYAQINSPKTVPSKSSTPKKSIKVSTPKSRDHSNQKSNNFNNFTLNQPKDWNKKSVNISLTSDQKKETKGSVDMSFLKPEDLLTCDEKREKKRAKEKSESEMNLKSAPPKIKRYFIQNLAKINHVMSKAPPILIFSDNENQVDSLPAKYLKIYDIDGNDTNLGFEENSVFIHTEGQEPERINYDEISQISFIPYHGYNDSFVIFALDTVFGIKVLPFVERKYTSIIERIINERH